MERYPIHTNSHSSAAKNYFERVSIHRNSKNILSILFDEVNCCEEKFDKLKKELLSAHRHHYSAFKEQCNEVFSSHT